MRAQVRAEASSGGDRPLEEYAGRPQEFFTEVLGLTTWSKQTEIVKSVCIDRHKETWVRACNGVGKTMISAMVAEYEFSACGRSVITTAPTNTQVRTLLWQALRSNALGAKQRLPGHRPAVDTEIRTSNPNWFMRGFATDKPENAQGPHIDDLLIIVDEAAGVPSWMFKAIKGWMTNPGCRLLCIGNPNSQRQEFYQAFHERLGSVYSVHISAYDSPNYIAGEQVVPGIVGREWVEDRKEDYGEGSIDWITKVLGDFPIDSDEKVLPMAWIEQAFLLGDQLDNQTTPEVEPITKAALDVARKGKDKCALVYLQGQRIRVARYWDEPNTTRTAKAAIQWVGTTQPKPEWLIVDANAVGGGTYDAIEEIKTTEPAEYTKQMGACQIHGLDWGAQPDVPARYCFVVDELYGRLRHAFSPETAIADRLALPTEAELRAVGLTRNQLAAQLNARKFEYDERNRMKVETKKKLKARKKELGMHGASPDVADAIAALLYKPKSTEVWWFST